MSTGMDLKKMKPIDYVKVFFKGMLLGLISVGIPGISASTIGIIIGIYFLMVESIANIFKDFKHNFPFLIVLILGYGSGAVGAAASVTILYKEFPLITTFAILGFLFGAIPDMVTDLKGGFKKVSNWVCLLVVVVLLLAYNFTIKTGADVTFPQNPTIGYLIAMGGIGLVTSATFVIPGIDFAVVFLSLGIYYSFMNMILELVSFGSEEYMVHFVSNAKILGCYLVGYFIGIFLFSKLIKTLTQKYDSQSRFASLGFVVASPVIVVKSCLFDGNFNPQSVTKAELVVGFGVAIFFLWLTIFVMRYTHKKKLDDKVSPLKEDTVDNRWHMDKRLRNVFFHEWYMAIYLNYTIKKRAKKEHTLEEAFHFCQNFLDRYIKDLDVTILRSGEEYLKLYQDGCVFMGNHQGKNDPLIALSQMKEHPTTFLINDDRSHMFLMGPVVDYMFAKRIKFSDLKSQIRVYNEMTEELKNGRSFLLFPEAMYNDNKNTLNTFNTPCFVPVIKSQKPIVPFVLYDTWKTSDSSIKGHLDVQIHFLKPIDYEEYKNLNKRELSELVRDRIREKINELDEKRSFPLEEELFEEKN